MDRFAVDLDHVSHSQIETWQSCPYSWKLSYVDGIRGPANANLVIGNVYHKFQEELHKFRAESGTLLPVEDCMEVCADIWDKRMKEGRIAWQGESPGKSKDTCLRLVAAFMETIAPGYEPQEVERWYEKPLEKVNFVGSIDSILTPEHFCEHKTSARAWTQDRADKAGQPSAHAWVVGTPISYTFYVAVKTAKPYIQPLHTTRTAEDIVWWTDMARGVIILMKQGVAPPNENSTWCTPKYCFHYPHCTARIRKRFFYDKEGT